MNEITILRELEHPFILKFNSLYKFDNKFHLITELVDSETLYDFILREETLLEESAALIIKYLLEALVYLEENGIIHRDIKLENILVVYESDDIKIKLIDFGLAIKINEVTGTKKIFGSPGYIAPEILRGSEYSTKTDVFSAGVILYTL